MQNTMKKPADTGTDSLFGMALAQSFMGVAFGLPVEQLWEAGEISSAVYTDRFDATTQAPAKGRNNFQLGMKKSLGGIFAGLHQTLAEQDRATFKPALSMSGFSAPAFA